MSQTHAWDLYRTVKVVAPKTPGQLTKRDTQDTSKLNLPGQATRYYDPRLQL